MIIWKKYSIMDDILLCDDCEDSDFEIDDYDDVFLVKAKFGFAQK